mmetsp:Transcript_37302/g.96392  ORF Transcript_37302/g.96392 Transcript_37302/m.96392 type:complete len:278 (+) Transcript_37302:1263-2096(+)
MVLPVLVQAARRPRGPHHARPIGPARHAVLLREADGGVRPPRDAQRAAHQAVPAGEAALLEARQHVAARADPRGDRHGPVHAHAAAGRGGAASVHRSGGSGNHGAGGRRLHRPPDRGRADHAPGLHRHGAALRAAALPHAVLRPHAADPVRRRGHRGRPDGGRPLQHAQPAGAEGPGGVLQEAGAVLRGPAVVRPGPPLGAAHAPRPLRRVDPRRRAEGPEGHGRLRAGLEHHPQEVRGSRLRGRRPVHQAAEAAGPTQPGPQRHSAADGHHALLRG